MLTWLRVLLIAFAVVLGEGVIRAADARSMRRRLKPTFGRSSVPTVSIATAPRTRKRAGSICGWCDFKLPAESRVRRSCRAIRTPATCWTEFAPARCRRAARKLSPKEIETIARWIAAGAKTERPEPESIAPGLGITDGGTLLVVVSADQASGGECSSDRSARADADRRAAARVDARGAYVFARRRQTQPHPALVL